MASYTYVNGIYEVTTQIHDGYKRFNHRNAQYRYTFDDKYMIEHWDFVSYAYPCMRVNHTIDDDAWFVLVTHDGLECSRTTTRQIGDFLRYIGCPITVSDIRMTIKGGYSCMYFGATCGNVLQIRGEVNSRFDIRF